MPVVIAQEHPHVRPTFRGAGFGGLIMDHLAGHARSHGVTLLRLETDMCCERWLP